MSNPWLKKNPFLSMWLTGANSLAGSLRGQATVAVRRQVRAAMAEAARENARIWIGPARPAATRAKRKR